MTWLEAIILGIVEGITEFLPISSTGHLIIAGALLGMNDEGIKDSLDGFFVIMQGCSLLAIIGLYWPRMKQMIFGLLGRDRAGLKLFLHIVLAFLPMGILAPLLYGRIREHLFEPGPVLAALALGGVWMIWIDRRRNQLGDDAYQLNMDNMTWKHALGIGLFQCASMWPGTSRAMMTIAGATVLGMKPARAAEFSFLLGLPTIAGATVYELYREFFSSRAEESPSTMVADLGLWPIVIGCVVTVIVAAATVKWLVAFLSHHGLSAFGWYRIALTFILGTMIATGFIALQ